MKAGPPEAGEASTLPPPTQWLSRGIPIADLVLRIVAVAGTLGSALAMGTTSETLPISFQFVSFRARYNDLPMLTFFVIANSVVCFYLFVSLPLSIFHIIRSGARITRLILVFFDAAMLGVLTAGASAAAAVVYLAHKGNASANWPAVCQQYGSFCERISGSLIGSFGVALVFIVLIFLLAIALSR
ncbi:hypothetical protein NMG60_11009248, partial [Bertholletia excelsa]